MKPTNYRNDRNDRIQDVITWEGLPHPDPRSACAATVRVAPSFWNRLRQHLRDARDANVSSAARSLWERWLTPEAVDALVGTTTTIDPATGTSGVVDVTVRRGGRRAGEPVPPTAVERLRGTLAGSLDQPLALCFEPGATLPSCPSLYYLVLNNGASLVLRGSASSLEVEDCFFTRAAVEACDTSDVVERSAKASEKDLRPGLSGAMAALPFMAMSTPAFHFIEHAPSRMPSDAAAASFIESGGCREAVVRELVRRYAVADDANGFVLPANGSTIAAARSDQDSLVGYRRVSFLRPHLWGFASTTPGERWVGFMPVNGDDSHDHPRLTNKQPAAPAPLPASPAADFSASFSCLNDLTDLLRRPEVRAALAGGSAHSESKRAVYLVAVTLGECRIFGGEEGDRTDVTEPVSPTLFTLSPAAAVAAGEELRRRLDRWITDAEALRDRLQSLGGAAAEDLRLGLLESRMEAWAAYLAIDACYTAAVDAGHSQADAVAQVVDALLTRIEDFDAALQHCEPCLAAVEDAQLLTNWRRMLAGPFRDVPPWWLDRACETTAHLPRVGAR